MNTNSRKHPSLARAVGAIFALALAFPSQAQIVTGFETSDGYTAGQTVYSPAVDDTGIPGGAVWQDMGGAFASSANPQSGALALRIQSDGTKVFGTKINLSGAGLDWNDAAAPIKFSFGMAISGYSAGTTNQVMIYLGDNLVLPGGAKYWTTLIFSNGELFLYKGNASGNNTAMNLGAYTTYSALGEYITFDITFNPVTKTYLNVSLTGANASADLTSSFAGVTVPWYPQTIAEPAQWLQFLVGGNDIVTVDFDNLRLANIPEPSAAALLGGAIGLLAAAARRRPRSARK